MGLQNSNWASVGSLLRLIGHSYTLIQTPSSFENFTHIVIPGVGKFGAVIDELKARKLYEPIKRIYDSQIKVLGICSGMQIMGESSDESPGSQGFAWLPYRVESIKELNCKREFHTGWNTCQEVTWISCPLPLFNSNFFFNHSFAISANNQFAESLATTEFGRNFISAFSHKNVVGVQFHPEKSQLAGKLLIERFLTI